MPEAVLLVASLVAAGVVVLWPLRGTATGPMDDDRDAAAVRHRVALEALRDVEADRRAGSLDDETYAAQRSEAESRAAATASELESAPATTPAPPARGLRTAALVTATVIAVGLVAGSFVPAAGVANATDLDCDVALGRPGGEERRECLDRLLDDLAADPDDPAALSNLADAYLSGSTTDDLANAVRVLQAVIALDPERTDAYERVVAAYLRAGDHANARRALDSYAALQNADPVELAFLEGLVALREADEAQASDAFGRFLELAPDDPRAEMVRRLRDDLSD